MTEPQAFTIAVVPVATPEVLRDAMIAHLQEHDVRVGTQDGVSTAEMPEYGMTIALAPKPEGLEVRIGAPSDGHLHFMREEVIEQAAKLDPEAADRIRWDNSIPQPARPANFHVMRVVESRDLFEGMRRVTVEGDGVADMSTGGFHVRIILPMILHRSPKWPTVAPNGGTALPRGEDALHARILTIRALDLARGQMSLDIAIHADGFVSEWAKAAEPGSELGIMGPGGEKGFQGGGPFLFAGDRTAFAAIARNVEALGDGATGLIVVASPDDRAASEYFQPTALKTICYPEGRFGGNVVDIVRETVAGGSIKQAWFGGEFADAQAMRAYFRGDLGCQRAITCPWPIGGRVIQVKRDDRDFLVPATGRSEVRSS